VDCFNSTCCLLWYFVALSLALALIKSLALEPLAVVTSVLRLTCIDCFDAVVLVSEMIFIIVYLYIHVWHVVTSIVLLNGFDFSCWHDPVLVVVLEAVMRNIVIVG